MTTDRDEAIVNVSLTREDKRRLDSLVKRVGMTQKSALGRLIEWLTRQDPIMQAMALQIVPGDTADSLLEFLAIKHSDKALLGGALAESIAARVSEHLHERRVPPKSAPAKQGPRLKSASKR